jgi:hypothetical protein
MARVLVLVGLATIFGHLEAAPVPKGGPKPPWKFPTRVGTKWVYTESSDRDAEVTESITKVEDEGRGVRTITIRYESEWEKGGAKWGVIDYVKLWLDDEGLFETSGKPTLNPTVCLLKFRCAVEDMWERKPPDGAVDRTVSRVTAEEKVEVPAGAFECVRVETKSYQGEELTRVRTDWYAAGVGLVKSTGYPNAKRVRVLKAFTPGKG